MPRPKFLFCGVLLVLHGKHWQVSGKQWHFWEGADEETVLQLPESSTQLYSKQTITCGWGWKECSICASSSGQHPSNSECNHSEQSCIWDAKVQAGWQEPKGIESPLITSRGSPHFVTGKKGKELIQRGHNKHGAPLLKASVQGQKCYLGNELNWILAQLVGIMEKQPNVSRSKQALISDGGQLVGFESSSAKEDTVPYFLVCLLFTSSSTYRPWRWALPKGETQKSDVTRNTSECM